MKLRDRQNVNVGQPYPDLKRQYKGVSKFKYLTPLVLRRELMAMKFRNDKEDADYIVAEDYSVQVVIEYKDGKPKPETITVPWGMLTDLVSVPAIARTFIDRVGPYLEAAIVHDFLYVAWQDIKDRGAQHQDKSFADDVLLAGMIEAGVGWTKRNAIYAAVVAKGWGPYSETNRHRYVDWKAGPIPGSVSPQPQPASGTVTPSGAPITP